jgi:hypothetical protein
MRTRTSFLKGRHGDRANAVLAAAGYNFSLLLRWYERLLRALRHSSRTTLGRRRLKCQPSSRTGENPPYGMIGGIEETSPLFEARSAPRSYPTEGESRMAELLDQSQPPDARSNARPYLIDHLTWDVSMLTIDPVSG